MTSEFNSLVRCNFIVCRDNAGDLTLKSKLANKFKQENTMKNKFAYIIALSSILSCGMSNATPIETKGFTVAVISEEPSSSAIKRGMYKKGLSLIAKKDTIHPFYEAMNLCVVSIKSKSYEDDGKACDSAIEIINSINKPNTSRLKAIAYSNRAIKSYLSNDLNRAVIDFKRAASLSSDKVVVKNINYFNELTDL